MFRSLARALAAAALPAALAATATLAPALASARPAPVVRSAQWNGVREILGVLGSGAPGGAEVEILDAASGTALATATADRMGRFHSFLRMDAPDAPCAVRVRIADRVSAPRRVDRGPAHCGRRG
jgi:hypothetical protein